jgi:hypothetical protein
VLCKQGHGEQADQQDAEHEQEQEQSQAEHAEQEKEHAKREQEHAKREQDLAKQDCFRLAEGRSWERCQDAQPWVHC